MSEKKPVDTEAPVSGAPVSGERKRAPFPAAGPHARKDLTNYDATPGAGSLPGPDEDDSQDTVSS